MERLAELERLADVAAQQADWASNKETRELLLQISRQYVLVAAERRAVLNACKRGAQPL